MTKDAIFWDRIARGYAKRPVSDEGAYATTLERVRAYLDPQGRALELGCGTGTTALKLADAVREIVAADVSSGMVAIANEKKAAQAVENVQFVQADELMREAPEGSFDAVMGFNLYHLIRDRAAAFARAHALLKRGGVFLSKTPCLGDGAWYLKPLVAVVRLVMRIRHGGAPDVAFFSREALEREIRAAGFEIVETGDFPASPPNHFVVARKLT